MSTHAARAATRGPRPLAVFAWAWVGIPFSYGLYQLLIKIDALFSG